MSFFTLLKKNHVATLQFDRVKSGNSVNLAVMEELNQLITTCYDDQEIRALIITGTDRFFISGGDLKEFHDLTSEDDGKMMAVQMQDILLRLEFAPFYTIAAVNGLAYGGGCETMLACDFIVAADDSVFGFTQGKFYLPPGWGGLTRLIHKVGKAKALEWLGRQAVITPPEALQSGLVNHLYPADSFLADAENFALELTKNDREFIQNLKQQAANISLKDMQSTIAAETTAFAKFWAHDEHLKRVQNFLSRRGS